MTLTRPLEKRGIYENLKNVGILITAINFFRDIN
jgi:hypothetical protein